jgi:hypothetical protein
MNFMLHTALCRYITLKGISLDYFICGCVSSKGVLALSSYSSKSFLLPTATKSQNIRTGIDFSMLPSYFRIKAAIKFILYQEHPTHFSKIYLI